MKKYYYLALLMVGLSSNAQNIRFINEEYLTIATFVDPGASFKEHGVDFGGEVQLVSYKKYVKAGVEHFSVLEGGFTSFTGTIGPNLTSGYFANTRFYTGLRLGGILRVNEMYPLAGLEAGIDYLIGDCVYIGVRTTGDWRADFRFSGADPGMRWSGFGVIGLKLGRPWEGLQRRIVRNAYKKVY